MNSNQVKTAKAKIRAHYHLDRPVTDAELEAELAMLRRHNAGWNLRRYE